MTLVQALQFTVEELQEKSLEELQELHSVLATSKQKKARLRADLISGIISAKKKEQAKEKVEEEKEVKAENSVKPKVKPKAKPKAKAQEEAQADAQAQKAEDKPKKAKKKADNVEKQIGEMTKDELLEYVKQLQKQLEKQEKQEIFPQVIEGEKVRFVQVLLETIKDIQKVLLEKPYQLYLFADERLDELTQFIVLFANAEIVVLLDRNQQRNSTVTLKVEQLKGNYIVFEKEGKFAYRFYLREAKSEGKSEGEHA